MNIGRTIVAYGKRISSASQWLHSRDMSAAVSRGGSQARCQERNTLHSGMLGGLSSSRTELVSVLSYDDEIASAESDKLYAEQLAHLSGLPVFSCRELVRGVAPVVNVELKVTGDELFAHFRDIPAEFATEFKQSKPFQLNLQDLDTRSGAGRSLSAPLFKAAGVKKGEPRPTVVDLSGGLCKDAYLLAATGCQVLAFERCVPLFLLGYHAIRKAKKLREEAGAEQLDLKLVLGDSREALHSLRKSIECHVASANTSLLATKLSLPLSSAALSPAHPSSAGPVRSPNSDCSPLSSSPSEASAADAYVEPALPEVEVLHFPSPFEAIPDCFYLDPMFSISRKSAEKKDLKVARMLAGDDVDAEELLREALRTLQALPAGRRRVSVKRSAKADPLLPDERPPSHSYKGKAVRFDVYL